MLPNIAWSAVVWLHECQAGAKLLVENLDMSYLKYTSRSYSQS